MPPYRIIVSALSIAAAIRLTTPTRTKTQGRFTIDEGAAPGEVLVRLKDGAGAAERSRVKLQLQADFTEEVVPGLLRVHSASASSRRLRRAELHPPCDCDAERSVVRQRQPVRVDEDWRPRRVGHHERF